MSARKKSLLYSFFAMLAVLAVCMVFALLLRFGSRFDLTVNQNQVINHTIILTLFLVPAALALVFSFRKSVGPEIYFFIIFLFSLSFECLKAVFLYLMLSRQSVQMLTVFSKIIYCTRVFTVFSLVSASLFCTGLETRRIVILLATILFVSVFFGMNIIVTSDAPSRYLIFLPGYKKELYFFFSSILVFNIFNYIYGTGKSGSRDYLILGLASLLASAGTIMLYFSISLLFFLGGMILLAAGVAIYAIKIHSVYLWI